MITAIMLDMDGVLVDNEKLMGLSVGMAVQRLRALAEPDPTRNSGLPGDGGGVAGSCFPSHVDKLGLEPDLRPIMSEYGASEPWEALGAMRRAIYDDMVADPQLVRDNKWPHTVGLLLMAKENNCKTGLATLSARTEALHFISALGLEHSLDVVLAREDVKNGKPAPDIYLLAAEKLGVEPQDCVVPPFQTSAREVPARLRLSTP